MLTSASNSVRCPCTCKVVSGWQRVILGNSSFFLATLSLNASGLQPLLLLHRHMLLLTTYTRRTGGKGRGGGTLPLLPLPHPPRHQPSESACQYCQYMMDGRRANYSPPTTISTSTSSSSALALRLKAACLPAYTATPLSLPPRPLRPWGKEPGEGRMGPPMGLPAHHLRALAIPPSPPSLPGWGVALL